MVCNSLSFWNPNGSFNGEGWKMIYEIMMIFLWVMSIISWIFVLYITLHKKEKVNYNILMIFWWMILVFNLSMAINNSNPFQWVMVGVAIGSLIMLYITIPHTLFIEKTLKRSFNTNKELLGILNK